MPRLPLSMFDRQPRLWAAIIAALTLLGLVGAAWWARVVLLAALLLGGVLLRRRRLTGATRTHHSRSGSDVPKGVINETEALPAALEVVRAGTGAREASLWQAAPEGQTARCLAWSGGGSGPPAEVGLPGHPFGWVILEQVHMRLERGRKPLPSPWAAEMLLVPVDAPEGLLALAYETPPGPDAEAAAMHAARHLHEVLSLLADARKAAGLRRCMEGLIEAVRTLPEETDPERFGEILARTALGSTSATGSVVAGWRPGEGRGSILGGAGDGARLRGDFAAGDSRLSLAARHGTPLVHEDLRLDRPPLPLCVPEEQFDLAPRSALVYPLRAAGQTLGVMAAWHAAPRAFSRAEKESLELLAWLAAPRLRNALRYQDLDQRASSDPLTRLPNRAALESRLAVLAGRFNRYRRPFGIIMLDIDHFKTFNDSFGHEAGDEVLRHLAGILRASLRQQDLPARFGGEEFLILLPEIDLQETQRAAERLREALEHTPLRWDGRDLRVTASWGVAACPDAGIEPSELLRATDSALYQAKASGRNCVRTASSSSRSGLDSPALTGYSTSVDSQ